MYVLDVWETWTLNGSKVWPKLKTIHHYTSRIWYAPCDKFLKFNNNYIVDRQHLNVDTEPPTHHSLLTRCSQPLTQNLFSLKSSVNFIFLLYLCFKFVDRSSFYTEQLHLKLMHNLPAILKTVTLYPFLQ